MNLLLSNPFFLSVALLNVLLVMIFGGIFFVYSKLKSIESQKQTQGFGEKRLKNKIAKKINNQVEDQFGDVIDKTAQVIESEVKKQAVALADEATRQSKQLSDFVQAQESGVVKESQAIIANSVLKAQKELEDYKREQMAKVDHEITAIVFSAAREVLGRAISLSEHEDLVTKALERAKRDKFFT